MTVNERATAIKELESLRQSKVISYITSTRPGLESQMAMDVISPFFEHLQQLAPDGKVPRIDLFIHSNGGDGIVPWRLVTLIREYCEEFNVLVPNRAFSAATLTALGADEVVMHPMGMLGPTDPTVTNPFNPQNPLVPQQLLGISVEDVASYFQLVKEDVGIHHEDELIQAFNILAEKVHPLALGNVKRSTLQSRMMGQKLLSRRAQKDLNAHDIDTIIQKLTSELYFHGHPINRREAREDVGLTFVKDALKDVETAMWKLFLLYESVMKLSQPHIPLQEAISINPLQVPVTPQPFSVMQVKLPTATTAIIESATLCHSFELEIEFNLVRDQSGLYNGNPAIVKPAWVRRP